MAGGDLAEMSGTPTATAARLIEDMHAGIEILSEIAAPVVACVQGAVAGGGLGLMLACDLCIASSDAKFSLAYPQVGASSDCGTSWTLTRVVGLRKAMEIAFMRDHIEAPEAERLGLVNQVVSREEFREVTLQLARRPAMGPTLAFGRLKRLLRQAGTMDLTNQMRAEAKEFLALTTSSDFQEGLQSFLQKRRPNFTGS